MAIDGSKIIKVNDHLSLDTEHGIVSGWIIVCTVDGEPYYDLNVDVEGVHKGKAVPEHITKDAALVALVDASAVGIMPGNEMHEGPDTGHFTGLIYLDNDIAKAAGMTTKYEGIFGQYKPEPDVLQKFKDGTYTGFSMQGARIKSEEVAD